MGSFVVGTTAYPVVALVCRALAEKSVAEKSVAEKSSQFDEARELAWSAAPLIFLGALAALFAFMDRKEKESE